MSSEANAFWAGFGLALFLCVLLLAIFQLSDAAKEKAVKAGHAHYNQMTGEFEWNKPCGEVPK